jgi:hypothetical protein
VTTPAGHWIEVRLAGTHGNRDGIGAVVEVGTQQAQRVAGSGYLGQDDGRLHFGLGSATRTRIVVTWPGGKRQTLENVTADQVVTIREE